MACAACEERDPSGESDHLEAADLAGPWPRSAPRCPPSTLRQGIPATWRRSVGWLPFTVNTRCAPRAAR